MVRIILLLVLIAFVARAFWKIVDGVLQGVRGGPPGRVPTNTPPRGVHMARDPVCGTYVIPERAVSLTTGDGPLFFCSDRCRDAFRRRTA